MAFAFGCAARAIRVQVINWSEPPVLCFGGIAGHANEISSSRSPLRTSNPRMQAGATALVLALFATCAETHGQEFGFGFYSFGVSHSKLCMQAGETALVLVLLATCAETHEQEFGFGFYRFGVSHSKLCTLFSSCCKLQAPCNAQWRYNAHLPRRVLDLVGKSDKGHAMGKSNAVNTCRGKCWILLANKTQTLRKQVGKVMLADAKLQVLAADASRKACNPKHAATNNRS